MLLFAGGVRPGYGSDTTGAAMTLWQFYGRQKFDAATLSPEDLTDVGAIPAATRPILTLANVVKADGSDLAPPVLYREVKTRDGREVRVAIIGLVGRSPFEKPASQPSSAAAPDGPWKVKNATETLRAVLPEARKKADIVVVLFAAMRDEARLLATAVPGVDVMIAGLEGGVMRTVEKVGTTALVQNSDRGRYAAQLGLTLGPDKRPTAYDLRVVAMDANIPDDPDTARLVMQYKEGQATPAIPSAKGAADTGAAGLGNAAMAQKASIYSGSHACGSCHADEFKQWRGTKHAVAMQTLENDENGLSARRRDCVSCHVVGFGKPDGFTIENPRWELRDVGCESCHGPGAAHVAIKRAGREETGGAMRKPTEATCLACHTKDNSPSFDYDRYLPHVTHKFKGKLPELPHDGMAGAGLPTSHS